MSFVINSLFASGQPALIIEMGFQDPEVPVAEDFAVALIRLDERSCRPPERHLAVLPVRHSSGLLPGSGVDAVDEVGRTRTFLTISASWTDSSRGLVRKRIMLLPTRK